MVKGTPNWGQLMSANWAKEGEEGGEHSGGARDESGLAHSEDGCRHTGCVG